MLYAFSCDYEFKKLMNLNLPPITQLENFRQIGDQKADSFIGKFLLKNGHHALRQLMPYLSDYKNIVKLNPAYKEIEDFIKSNSELPIWHEQKEIIRACEFYQKYTIEIGMMLSCYSLPYCYLGAKGAQVLVMTERIKNDTYNRLKETGLFLQNILDYSNWQNGKALIILAKVRLLHACVRQFVKHSKKYNTEINGIPVNQEDMAGTNLAFSLIVLRGMRKTGIMFDHYYERAYLHFWKVAGYFLGIEEPLLVSGMKEAMLLDKEISSRQFEHSSAGNELTSSLFKCYNQITSTKVESEMITAQSRYLLGNNYADMLGIPKTKIPNALLKTYNYSSSFLTNIYK